MRSLALLAAFFLVSTHSGVVAARGASGDIPVKEAQDRAPESLAAIRSGADEYVFAHALDGTWIFHLDTKRIGKPAWDRVDATGVHLTHEMVARAREGGGFTPYVTTRLGSTEPAARLGYSRLIGPWGRVVATGVYTDDIAATMWRRARHGDRRHRRRHHGGAPPARAPTRSAIWSAPWARRTRSFP